MVEYISGTVKNLSPTSVVIDNHGIGYIMEISLQTYNALQGKSEASIFIQHQLNQRDGSEIDYGFASTEERDLFRNITSVSGMGASSARMILSAMSANEFREVILTEDISRLKTIKGIGLKSAQRLVLELKDKINKAEIESSEVLFRSETNNYAEEAAAALFNLGFAKANITKAIQKILKDKPESKVEDIIKSALKIL